MRMQILLLVVFMMIFALAGCSGSGSPTAPEVNIPRDVNNSNGHTTWGLWQFKADPEKQTLDVVPLREGSFHLNALPFLEPPPSLYLSVESISFSGNVIDTDIGLRHPFIGVNKFTGFDVCGLLITNGSVTGFTNSTLRMAGEDDTRLLNPDGLSRWWNPVEFPVNDGSIFAYTDGMLGTPDAIANFNCTLNGYKYFCDDITDPDDPLSVVTQENRGLFSTGKKNIRHYKIELGTDGLVFNYAVDASWKAPVGSPPWDIPGSFPPAANRPEAWRADVDEVSNTLYNDGASSGGGLSLSIDVYDWFNAGLNSVRIESPGNFTMVENAVPSGSGDGYSTYTIDIPAATPAVNEIELLISITSEVNGWGGLIPGEPVNSYFTHSSAVSGQTATQYHWVFDNGGLIYDNAQFDDLSPAVTWETDDQLRVYWTADSILGYIYYPEGRSTSMASTDGGETWGSFTWHWSHGNDGSLDHAKIAPAYDGNSYGIHPLCKGGGIPTSPYYYAAAGTNASTPPQWAFTMLPYKDSGEIYCDENGFIHSFGDGYGGGTPWPDIIEQQIGNQAWTLLNDISGFPPDTWSQMWYPLAKVIVANPGRISHVRSAADDSSGTIYLVYWGGSSGNFIKIARTTDGAAAQTWESVTVVDNPVYTDYRLPCIMIDPADRVHVSFLRTNTATSQNEIMYTYSDDGGDSWSAGVVAYSSPSAISDASLVAYQVLGANVVTVDFEVGEQVYLTSSFDAGQTWATLDTVSINSANSDLHPDFIQGTDGKLHFVFSHLDGADRDINFRNATLVQD